MKRKTLTLVLCLLTVMSLVGVGFASWVISADTSEKVEGNIVVDTVTDERYTVSVNVKNQNIIFAAPNEEEQAKISNPWLKQEFAAGVTPIYAKLTVVYEFTVTKNDKSAFLLDTDATTLKDLFIKVDFTEPSATVDGTSTTTYYEEAKEANLIGLFNTDGYKVSNVVLSNDSKTATFSVEIGYVWGAAFNGENPFTYYNAKSANATIAQDSTTTWADDAYAKLTALSKIDASCSYSATITVNRETFDKAQAGKVSNS